MNETLNIVRKLHRSPVYSEFKTAFEQISQFPIELVSSDGESLEGHFCAKSANAICIALAEANPDCRVCALTKGLMEESSLARTQTNTCLAGLTVTTIPVRLEGQLAAWIQTAPVLLQPPSKQHFARLVRRLAGLGSAIAAGDLKTAYFGARVVSPTLYRATIRLLEIYVDYIVLIGGKIMLQGRDSLIVQRAKRYFAEHQTRPVTLEEVAHAANVSVFHFCRTFKQGTGLTFTEYQNRLRVERAKALLRDNRMRVSEVAYEAGFQTITHFNRIFRRLVGLSPTDYRSN